MCCLHDVLVAPPLGSQRSGAGSAARRGDAPTVRDARGIPSDSWPGFVLLGSRRFRSYLYAFCPSYYLRVKVSKIAMDTYDSKFDDILCLVLVNASVHVNTS